MVMGYADGYSLAQNKYRVKYRANLHVDDHRLYLPDGRRSGRLGETRVVDVVDVKEVVVRYDEVRNAAAPLRTSIGRRSGRLGETRVVDVVDVKEVVVWYDEVRNAAAPLRTSIGRRSGRLGETRVVDVVDVKEVVVRYDKVRNAAAPLRTSTRTERKNGAMECASTQSPHLRDNSSTREFFSPQKKALVAI
jgi:hypothetical protein